MITESFNERTVANMEVALDRACKDLAHGGDHSAREHIARKILGCARRGDTTLKALTAAARIAAMEILPAG